MTRRLRQRPQLRIAATSLLLTALCPPAQALPDNPTPSTQPTTQPAASLQAEIIRTVELAQRAIRAEKPPPPAKNSLQRAEQQSPPDPLPPLAHDLVGASGLISFRVTDVIPNDGLHFPNGAPPEALEIRRSLPYLVIAEIDNPSPLQLSPNERRQIQEANQKGQKNLADTLHSSAEQRRPSHRLFIATDDPATKDWTKGDRRSVRGTIIGATLERTPGGYARANIVVRHDRTPTTTPAVP